MLSPRVFSRHIGSSRAAALLCLAAMLPGCSSQPPHSQPATAPIHAGAGSSEQCSIVAVMACRAVSLLSGEGGATSTCSAYRGSSGARIETCGSEAKAQASGAGIAGPDAHSVSLSWADNSNNENEFVIERCDRISQAGDGKSKSTSCTGEWKRIGVVAANATSYVDHTAVLNQTYIYRVKASNSAGSSSYTDEVTVTTPAP